MYIYIYIYNHRSLMNTWSVLKRLVKSETDTDLSKEFWRIKDNKRSANIIYDILGRHQAYSTSSKGCSLCLNEKLKKALRRNKNMLIDEPKY